MSSEDQGHLRVKVKLVFNHWKVFISRNSVYEKEHH